MRLLGSEPMSHLCDQKRRSIVTGLSDLMTLFIDLGCLYCKQTQRAFNVFQNTLNWLEIDSVDQKFNWLECGNFSRRWNAWHWESHCVFTAGGEWVKAKKSHVARVIVIDAYFHISWTSDRRHSQKYFVKIAWFIHQWKMTIHSRHRQLSDSEQGNSRR
jgi:hypothetical protein